MINLTDSDKSLIGNNTFSRAPVNLSIGKFYIKNSNKAYALKELIGARIATTIFELKCPDYYVVLINGDYFVLSKDLNLEGNFLTLEKIGIEKYDNSLYDAWHILEQKYGKAFNEMIDFIKIYIFDVLFHNLDRKAQNLGILFLPDKSRKVVIFDNELMLSNDTKEEYGTNSEEYLELHTTFETTLNIYHDFKRFLLESSTEFVLLFKHYFELITPEYFSALINEIALENEFDLTPILGSSLTENLSELYAVNYSRLQAILESLERGDEIAR